VDVFNVDANEPLRKGVILEMPRLYVPDRSPYVPYRHPAALFTGWVYRLQLPVVILSLCAGVRKKS